MKFDEKTGFLTLPYPYEENRNLSFRIENGWYECADREDVRWEPRRLATAEECAMYLALRNLCVTGNAGVTARGKGEARG